jgi:acyl carrier protein
MRFMLTAKYVFGAACDLAVGYAKMGARCFSATWASGMKDKIRTILAAECKLAVEVGALQDDSDLYSMGLTSFDSVQLMLGLEDGFGVEFSEKMLNRRTFQSIASIAAALTELQA